MNGSKQKYRLDDYLQDKAARAAQPLSRGGASGVGQNAVVTPTNSYAVPTVKGMAVKPPHVVQKPASLGAAAVSTGQNVTVDIANPDTGASAGGGTLTQSQMTTAYTKQLMESALQGLLEMQNRKFKYDAKSSPLYSIVQKQAEENARLASGRAYAQAKAATGGYGSSYATLAADEAGRQAMREMDDQQLALYEAARSEFEAENRSALDWYNTTKQLYADAYAMEQDAKANATTTMTLEDGTTVEVDDTNVQSAYEYIAAAMQNGGTIDQVENTIREGLKNQRTADGKAYTENEINAAIEKYKGVEKAVVADTQKNTGTVLDKGLRNDKELNAEDLITLGIDATAWGEMDEATRKTNLLEAAGQAKKDGRLSTEQYTRLLENDVNTTLNAIRTGKVDKKATELAALAMDLEGYRDNGYLSEAEYTAIIDRMLAEIDPEKLVAEQTRSLGEKITGTDDDESGLNEIIDIAITGGLSGVIGFGGPLLSAMMGSLASNNNFQKLIHFKKEERDMLAYLIGRKTAKDVTSKGAKGIGKK